MSVNLTHANSNRRRFMLGSLGLALAGDSALATSGCGGSTKGTVSSSAVKSLSFLTWDNKTDMQPVFNLFTQQSGTDLSITSAPPVKEYISTLRTRLKSGGAADVFILTAEDKELVPGGFVKDLSDKSFVDVMNSANREFMTVDGKVYGLSLYSWAGGIMYNKDLLATVGATSMPNSWDGFLKLCAKLKSQGVTPYYEAGGDGNFMSLWGLLGGYFADQGHFPDADIFDGKTTFAKTWTEPLVAWCRLYTEGLVPKAVAHMHSPQVIGAFGKKQVAMFGAGTWDVLPVRNAAPKLSFDTDAIPGMNKGTTYWTGAPGVGYAINAKARNPAAALKFLQFLASTDGVKVLGKSLGAITTTSNYIPPAALGMQHQTEGARSGRIYLPVVHWPRHADALGTEITKQIHLMIQGSVQPKEISAALDKKLKELGG